MKQLLRRQLLYLPLQQQLSKQTLRRYLQLVCIVLCYQYSFMIIRVPTVVYAWHVQVPINILGPNRYKVNLTSKAARRIHYAHRGDYIDSDSSATEMNPIDRRTWMKDTIGTAVIATMGAITPSNILPRPLTAAAAVEEEVTSTTTENTAPTLPERLSIKTLSSTGTTDSAVLCDSTISIWTIGDNNNNNKACTLYLLGTAHISDVSASLAGALVRQVHPDAVFVELDMKRLQNIPADVAVASSSSSSSTIKEPDSSQVSPMRPAILIPSVLPSSTLSTSLDSTPTSLSSSLESTSIATGTNGKPKNWFQRNLLNFAGAAVGKGISSMYSNLSASGFQPGEEFAVAIRTGRDIGATIVLGDQDVQITLRRLAEALSMTDLNQLLNPDSQLEQTMTNLLPSLPSATVDGNLSNSNAPNEATNDPTQFKRELSDYVEQMKSRGTVRQILQEFKVLAPEVVRVMLTERDAYMANGIHTLRQDYPKVVAVMGLAHMDGVERNLQTLGWRPVPVSCPK
jgi:TraB/PrgY/gumN family